MTPDEKLQKIISESIEKGISSGFEKVEEKIEKGITYNIDKLENKKDKQILSGPIIVAIIALIGTMTQGLYQQHISRKNNETLLVTTQLNNEKDRELRKMIHIQEMYYNIIEEADQKKIKAKIQSLKVHGEMSLPYLTALRDSQSTYCNQSAFNETIRSIAAYRYDLHHAVFADRVGVRIENRSKLWIKDFSKSNLYGADFRDCDIQGADFSFSYLAKSKFQGADLTKARFTNTDLHEAYFGVEEILNCQTTLNWADFTKSQLRRAQFQGADLTSAKFTNADLTEANFKRYESGKLKTNLKNVDFRGAKLDGVIGFSQTLDLDEAHFSPDYLLGEIKAYMECKGGMKGVANAVLIQLVHNHETGIKRELEKTHDNVKEEWRELIKNLEKITTCS